jgi:hypothetical protein
VPASRNARYQPNRFAEISQTTLTNDYEDPIAEFIEASAEGLCTAYIVIANIERINGDQSFWVTTLRNQTASTSLGLLESASAAEKYRIARSFNQHQDEDE